MLYGVVPGGGDSAVVYLSKAGSTHLHVPAAEIWLINWVLMRYVADATVATRYARVRVLMTAASDPQESLTLCGGDVTASQDLQWQCAPCSGTNIDRDNAAAMSFPLPCVGGMVIEGVVDAGAPAGDSWEVWLQYFKVRACR